MQSPLTLPHTMICSGWTRVLSALPLTDKPGLTSELEASWVLASFAPEVPWAGLMQEALLRTRHRASKTLRLSDRNSFVFLWLEGKKEHSNGLTRSLCQRTVRDNLALHYWSSVATPPAWKAKTGEKAQLFSTPVKGYEHISLYAMYASRVYI